MLAKYFFPPRLLKCKPFYTKLPSLLKNGNSKIYHTHCFTEGIICKLAQRGLAGYSPQLTHADFRTNLIPQNCSLITIRKTSSFFSKMTAEHLWKGVTSVSNVGKKRGRGRGRNKKIAKDLNRGQFIGKGVTNILFPGLNAPVLRGKDIIKQQSLPPDEKRTEKMLEARSRLGIFTPLKFSPLERGFSGVQLAGRTIGPPDPIGEDTFEGFDTTVLESKCVNHWTTKGKQMKYSIFSITGNKNGLAGFGLGKATTVFTASHNSKNVAGQNLLYFDLYNGHTVFHDFHCKFMHTLIFVKMKPKGYGLVCHRVIREICKCIGITDIHAKIDGAMNVQNITKAFIMGLLDQCTHQRLADDKQLYVAKVGEGMHPQILAAPSTGSPRSSEDIGIDEEMDFKLYLMGGKVELERKKFVPFYTRFPSFERHLKKQLKCRNHYKIKKQLMLEHGDIVSFLTEKHPECRPDYIMPEEDEDD